MIAPSRLSGQHGAVAIILLGASDALFVIKSEANPGLAIGKPVEQSSGRQRIERRFTATPQTTSHAPTRSRGFRFESWTAAMC